MRVGKLIEQDGSVEWWMRAGVGENRVVFFAGDLIPDYPDKRQLRVGEGVYLPQYRTLPNRFIPKCRLTVLKTGFHLDNMDMIPPSDRDKYAESITEWQPTNAAIRPAYPENEVKRMIKRRIYEMGGVVEIPSLRGAGQQTVDELNGFFFGKGNLKSIGAVEERIIAKRERISKRWPEDQQDLYRKVAEQMLESCVLFRYTAKDFIKREEYIVQSLKKQARWLGNVTSPVVELVQAQL